MTSRSNSGARQPGLVSVIVPSFNHIEYIERTIDSVLGQDHRSVELVVIDDGSKDGSVELLQALSRKHGFKFIAQGNAGVCAALNRAVREGATGEYIALLGSDDLWEPDKLSLQVTAMASDPGSEFCFAQARRFSTGTPGGDGSVFPRRCLTGEVVDSVFLRQHVPAGTMLFTRRLFDELGGFDETLLEEDWDFVIRSAAATRYTAVNRPLLHYRVHASNTMRTRNRSAIFHQKARILAKNFPLVSPARWLLAVALHFAHDLVFSRLLRR